jgi:hypothetical protein
MRLATPKKPVEIEMAERKNNSLLRIIFVAQLGIISGQRQITDRVQPFRLDTARASHRALVPISGSGSAAGRARRLRL